MQVTFESSTDGYVDSTLALQKHVKGAMGITTRAQLLWSLGFGVLIVAPLLIAGAYILQQVSGTTERLIELGFLVIAVGSLSLFCHWQGKRFVRRLAYLNRPIFGPTEVLLRDDALVVRGPKTQMELAWDGFEAPTLTDHALLIGFYSYLMVRIPRSAFSDEAELHDLMREIERRRQAHAEG